MTLREKQDQKGDSPTDVNAHSQCRRNCAGAISAQLSRTTVSEHSSSPPPPLSSSPLVLGAHVRFKGDVSSIKENEVLRVEMKDKDAEESLTGLEEGKEHLTQAADDLRRLLRLFKSDRLLENVSPSSSAEEGRARETD